MGGPSVTSSLSRYTHFELIGEGVSAKVYKARDTTTDTPVAVKVLNPHLKTDAISIERFRREIRITRFLGHPQVISIYDLIEAESLALVMEYVPGHDLKDYLRLRAPLAVATAVEFVVQMLRILAVCHRKNVIHRDLKPQNVIVGPDERLKLLDFGISRMTSLTDLTQTGTSLGSPEYMAPELFAVNAYDPRTDLYAVGVMAYEMLTGDLPFQGDSVAVLFHQHLEAPVPSISRRRSDVPGWLDDLVGKLLAKKPYERYQTAEEALADVDARRVISRSLPEVRRRDCVSCSRPTLAPLPICTYCGYDETEAFAPGACDVLVSPQEDPEKLRSFLQRVFRKSEPSTKRLGPLLASGVDRVAAELLKKSGLKHGLYLTIKKRPPYVDALRVLSSYVFLVLCLQVVGLTVYLDVQPTFSIYPVYLNYLVDTAGLLVSVIAAQVLVAWAAFRFFRWTHRRPVLGRSWPIRREIAAVAALATVTAVGVRLLAGQPGPDPDVRPWLGVHPYPGSWIVLVAVGIAWVLAVRFFEPLSPWLRGTEEQETAGPVPPELLARHRWVRELAALFVGLRGDELRISVSRLLEKYHLLEENAPGTSAEIRGQLRLLIDGAAQVAGVLSELESTVDDLELAAWSREYLACQTRLAAGAEDREELGRRLADAESRLRRYDDLDVKSAALRGRLIHLQYAFNSLLGKSLVLGGTLGEPEARQLEATVAELRRDLVVCQEVRHELRGLT